MNKDELNKELGVLYEMAKEQRDVSMALEILRTSASKMVLDKDKE